MKKMRMALLALLVLGASLFANLGLGVNVFAADSCNGQAFLGLTPWYKNLREAEGSDNCVMRSPTSDKEVIATVWTIVINVVTLLTEVIAYLAVAMVVYGGFLYIFSAGNQQRAAKGKKTITNSIVGIIICVLASSIMAMLSRFTSVLETKTSAEEFFMTIFNKAMVWAGLLCTIMLVLAGVQFATSVGNPQKTSVAKSTIINASIGLAVVVVAGMIVNFAVGAIFGVAK